MPISGDLRRIDLTRLAELLAHGRKSGLLTLRSGREGLEVHLRRGYVQLVRPLKGPEPTDSLWAVAGQSEAEVGRRLAPRGGMGAVLLLDFLGLSTREQSLRALRAQAVALLQTAAGWRKGEFRFEPQAEPPAGRLSLGLPLGAIKKQLAVAQPDGSARG